jgi:hypothetical protein
MVIPDAIAADVADAFCVELAGEVATALACSEVTALAALLTALGRPDLAAAWIDAHAEGDDEGDEHHRQPA